MATAQQLADIGAWFQQNPNSTEDQQWSAFNSYNAQQSAPITQADVRGVWQNMQQQAGYNEPVANQTAPQVGTNLIRDVTQNQINTSALPNWMGQLNFPSSGTNNQVTQPQTGNYLTMDQLNNWWSQNNPMTNFSSQLDNWWNSKGLSNLYGGGNQAVSAPRNAGNRSRYFNPSTGDYVGLGTMYSQPQSL